MFTKPSHLFFIENVQDISLYIEREGGTERQIHKESGRERERERATERDRDTKRERMAGKICSYEQQLHFLNVCRECYNYCRKIAGNVIITVGRLE